MMNFTDEMIEKTAPQPKYRTSQTVGKAWKRRVRTSGFTDNKPAKR